MTATMLNPPAPPAQRAYWTRTDRLTAHRARLRRRITWFGMAVAFAAGYTTATLHLAAFLLGGGG